MNVLIVFAHPEPASLSRSLLNEAVRQLESDGHVVQVSDLYAQQWKACVDHADFPHIAPGNRLKAPLASAEAFGTGTLTDDVVAEQEKLLWADLLILQFPLWWFSMPAILKGWVDRVYANGFAYGVGEHSATRWGDRYGEGALAGKRAMLVVAAGGWPEHYGPRGVNGAIGDLLFPINHGVLFYPGYDVLPPYVVYRTDQMDEAGFQKAAHDLRDRMKTAWTIAPIPYRQQNAGDYVIPTMELRDHLAANTEGLRMHQRSSDRPDPVARHG